MISALLPPVVSELRERYPSLSVTVQPVGAVHQRYPELRERRLDFIIGRIHPPYEDDVDAQTLYQETYTRRRRCYQPVEPARASFCVP